MSDGRGAVGTAASARRVSAFAVILGIDAALVGLLLATDKNLQTDFGSVPAYWAGWWHVVAGEVALIVLAGAVVATALALRRDGRRTAARRAVLAVALLASVLLTLATAGMGLEYSSAGFTSADQYYRYLFSPTPYPGALSYIPWLYDLVLAAFVVTVLIGAVANLTPTASIAS